MVEVCLPAGGPGYAGAPRIFWPEGFSRGRCIRQLFSTPHSGGEARPGLAPFPGRARRFDIACGSNHHSRNGSQEVRELPFRLPVGRRRYFRRRIAAWTQQSRTSRANHFSTTSRPFRNFSASRAGDIHAQASFASHRPSIVLHPGVVERTALPDDSVLGERQVQSASRSSRWKAAGCSPASRASSTRTLTTTGPWMRAMRGSATPRSS